MNLMRLSWLFIIFHLFAASFHAQIQKAELYVQTGHAGAVNGMLLSPDKKVLATAGDDNTVKLFDAGTKTEIRAFNDHSAPVTALSFSPDSKILATGGWDGFVKLREVSTGKEVPFLPERMDKITSLAFSADGKLLAVATWNAMALFDVATRKMQFSDGTGSMEGQSMITGIAFTPDSKLLVVTGFNFNEGFVRLLNLKGEVFYGELTRNFRNYSNSKNVTVSYNYQTKMTIVRTILVKNNGEVLDRYNTIEFYEDAPPSLRVLTETEKQNLNNPVFKEIEKKLARSSSPINSLYLEPNNNLLSAFRNDKTAVVWDLIKGDAPKFTANTNDSSPQSKDARNSRADLIDSIKSGDGENDRRTSLDYFELMIESEFQKFNVNALDAEKVIVSYTDNPKVFAALQIAGRGVNGLGANRQRVAVFAVYDFEKGVYDTTSKRREHPGKMYVVRLDSEKTLNDSIREKENEINPIIEEISAVVPNFKYKWLNWRNQPMTKDESVQAKLETNGIIKLVDPTNETELCSLIALGENDWSVVTPEGLFDGSPGAWKQMIWRLDGNTFEYAPVESFFNEFYYPGLLQEILRGKSPKPPERNLSEIDIRQPELKLNSSSKQLPASGVNDSTVRKSEIIKIEITDNASKPRKISFPKSSGAKDLRLFRNGALIKTWKKDVFTLSAKDGCRQFPSNSTTPRKTVCEVEVPLIAGDNVFTAYAFNHDNVKSIDAVAEINGADSLKRLGTMYVLAVGVNEYANPAFNLKYAVADVDAIGREISLQQSKMQSKIYAETKVISLINEQATKENFVAALSKFSGVNKESPTTANAELKKIEPIQPEDALIIYFAGHGLADKDRFYLIPHDGIPTTFTNSVTANPIEQKRLLTQGQSVMNQSGLDQLFKQSLSDIELEELLETVNAGKLMMVIDACNSGQALEAEEKRRGPMNSKGLAQLAYEKGMNILTASQSFQSALEASSLNHGLLTYALLEGLKKGDKNDDKSIVDREWLDYGVTNVPLLQIEAENKRLLTQNKTTSVSDKNNKAELQMPRVFYRRDFDLSPLVIALP